MTTISQYTRLSAIALRIQPRSLMRTRTLTQQTVFGIVILAATFGVLASATFPLMLLAYAAPLISAFLNVAWLAVFFGVTIYGIGWSKPGFVIAPFLFAVLWLGASATMRWRLQASIDPIVWNAPTSFDASASRTLIVNSFESVDRKIIADGHVDKLIKLHHDNSTHKIVSIEEISSAKGDTCSLEEKRASPEFQNSGRADECFKWRDVGEIPDGLVIERIHRFAAERGVPGCCNETQARLRTGGKERLLFSWYQGQAYVLSYFPVFAFFPQATRLWEPGSGPSHPVRYGLDNIEPRTMTSAIYRADPVYEVDRGGLRARSAVSAKDTLDQAESFAKQGNVSPKSVASLLISARQKGLVDERSIGIAASLVGHDGEGWVAVSNYASGLTNDQTELLLERVLQRIETPNICGDCLPSRELQNFSLDQWKLKERLSRPDELASRARHIFEKRSDLAAWQYEGSLKIITALGPQGLPGSENFRDQVILPMLLAEGTPAYSEKATAYLRAIPGRPIIASAMLAAKLDLVHDRDLKEYILGIWIGELTKLRARNASAETFAQAAKACVRISRISDPNLRRQNFGVDC